MKGTLYYQGYRLCDADVTVIADSPNGMVALPLEQDVVLRFADEDGEAPVRKAVDESVARAQADIRTILDGIAGDSRVCQLVAIEENYGRGVNGMWQVQQFNGALSLHVRCAPTREELAENVCAAVGCQLCGAAWSELADALQQNQQGFRYGLRIPTPDGSSSGYRAFDVCEACAEELAANEAEFADARVQLRESLAIRAFRTRQNSFKPSVKDPT